MTRTKFNASFLDSFITTLGSTADSALHPDEADMNESHWQNFNKVMELSLSSDHKWRFTSDFFNHTSYAKMASLHQKGLLNRKNWTDANAQFDPAGNYNGKSLDDQKLNILNLSKNDKGNFVHEDLERISSEGIKDGESHLDYIGQLLGANPLSGKQAKWLFEEITLYNLRRGINNDEFASTRE